MQSEKVRYGVVGLGHIAQTAVLPAFANANKNSKLEVLISEDEKKLKLLAKKYKIQKTYKFNELEECLENNEIDVLYVATPNDTHKEIVKLAAKHNVHVLCEKPMAIKTEDCVQMNQVAKEHKIKLMIAYRLHFESANLEAIKLCRSGKLGDLKFFNSSFSFQIKDKNNIRLGSEKKGGGAIYDIGTYCINASRYLFQAEPEEVFAMSSTSDDPRFSKCDEITSVIMKFPNNALASFTVSFGAFDSSDYEIIGSKGRVRLENAYEYAQPMTLRVFQQGKRESAKIYKKRDQFSAELLYFSNCIQKNIDPEPSAIEGLADIKIIEAILNSIKIGIPISLEPVAKNIRPSKKQEIIRPGIKKRKAFHATAPSKH